MHFFNIFINFSNAFTEIQYRFEAMRELIICLMLMLVWSCDREQVMDMDTKASRQPQYTSSLNWMGHWKDREGKEQLLYLLSREFELLNQDIDVNMKFPQDIFKQASYTNLLYDTVVTMIETNHYTWDIVYIDYSNYQNIANKLQDKEWGKKYLVNFEEYDWFKEIHKPYVFTDPKFRNLTGGQLIGPVVEGIYFTLWYNKKVAEKMGISVNEKDMKFDDFLGYIKTAHDYNKTASVKTTILLNEGIREFFTMSVLSQLGNFDTSRLDLAVSKMAVNNTLKEFEKMAAFKPLVKYYNGTDKDKALLDEEVLFVFTYTYSYNRLAKIDKAKAQNLVPVKIPVFEKSPMYYYGKFQPVWAVFKNAPNKENAVKVMKLLCTNDFAQQWLNLTKNPTALKSRISTSELAQDQFDRFYTQIDKEYGSNVFEINLSRTIFGQNNSSVAILPEAVLNGELTADEFYTNIVKKLK